MKQPILFFAIGLLSATITLLIIFTLIEKPQLGDQLSTDEMIIEIEKDGYHVLTNSEYITFSVNKDDEIAAQNENNDEENEPENDINHVNTDNDEKENEDEEPKEYEYTLIIEESMLGPNISDLLKEHQVIDDPDEFNRYLTDEGYAKYLQLGEYELSSEMSYEEIAETIAIKRE